MYMMRYRLKTGEELVVRKPNAKDAEATMNFISTVDGETKFLSREPEEFDYSVERERERILEREDETEACYMIGLIDDQVVAHCDVSKLREGKRSRYRHRATMSMAVREKFWGKGIAGKLITESIRWCISNSVEQLELSVLTTNTHAIQMYISFGFQITGMTRHSMKYSDGSYGDEYSMMLSL